ncbi:MAG: hypothetical protein WC776_02980 [Patescibacteria group bacterium]
MADPNLLTGQSTQLFKLPFGGFVAGAYEDFRAGQLAGFAEVEADGDQPPELDEDKPSSFDHEVWCLVTLSGSGFGEQGPKPLLAESLQGRGWGNRNHVIELSISELPSDTLGILFIGGYDLDVVVV